MLCYHQLYGVRINEIAIQQILLKCMDAFQNVIRYYSSRKFFQQGCNLILTSIDNQV